MEKNKLNIVFAGTPGFTLPCLDALLSSHHKLCAIYTQPDRPAGRGRKLQTSAAKTFALSHGLAVYQPLNFKNDADIETLKRLEPDLMIVIAYGIILPQRVLDIPRLGCINVHASLLPAWRGAAPIQHAILHGEKETGVTIMQMDAGMDTGPMLRHVTCSIDPRETAETLHDKLAHLAVSPLLQTIDDLAHHRIQPIAQKHEIASYASKISKEQARIDWHQSAQQIDQQIRAFQPWPIAFTADEQGALLRVHQAHVDTRPSKPHETPGTVLAVEKDGILVNTGEGTLRLERIQCAGGKVLDVRDWILGAHRTLSVGSCLQ